MCGITGYFGKGDSQILKQMNETLRHRGPDDEGFYLDEKVGLGHRRLSVIDLTPAGHQPMSNEDGTIWLAFNGEIYNFQELKKKLNHHRFKSNSDTEVIIHLYEDIGAEVFSQLDGMFAIALYDKSRNILILARDRLGKKPLYWGIFDQTLIFGSELKALMRHPSFLKKVDLRSLNKYLFYEYIPTPHSIFEGVYKLEPGNYLIYDGNKIKKEIFWDVKFGQSNITGLSQEDIIGELDKRINDAVKIRLVSDVPLGIFLSGGIDSSAIAYYAQKNSTQKIKTFSIGFKEQSFNELSYARLMASFLGTEHHEKILAAEDCLDLIPKIADLLDEPMADASLIPTFLLSRFTREYVTVAVGGDGGDELFCGYDTFVAHKLANIYEKIPVFFRKGIIEEIAKQLPVSFSNFSFDFRVKKFIAGFAGEKKYRHQLWLGAFEKERRIQLFNPDIWSQLKEEDELEDIDFYLKNLVKENLMNQIIFLYLRTYMMDDILVKVDRASMANALEVRAPLLDYKLVDYINSLPVDLKLRGLTKKYIFKKLMEDKLPKEIVWRKKKGFGIPLADWLSQSLKPLVLDLLDKKKLKNQGIFNWQYVDKLLDEHFNHRADNRKLIWTLLVWQIWQEKWC